MRRESVKVVALGIAGLALSAGLGGGAYLLTRDTIGLAVTELGAGAPLAPAAAAQQRAAPARRVTRTGDEVTPTVETRTESTESGETGDDSPPGAQTDTDGSSRSRTRTDDDSGSGRGRGRGRSSGGDSGHQGRDD